MTTSLSGQAKRAIRAALVVIALIGAIPLADAVVRVVRVGGTAAKVMSVGVSGQEAMPDLERALAPHDAGDGMVPASFEAETFSFAQLSGVSCSKGSGLIGFTMPSTSQQAFLQVEDWLQEAGWNCVVSGQPNRATFTKQQGRYRWLFVSSVDVGSKASVVMQCERFYEE